MIKFSNICKSFNGYNLLQGINFEIKQGEMACLIGQSGVGKSTIIHMIIAAQKPDSGEIIVKGQHISQLTKGNISDLQKFRREVGFIFQDYKLLENKTVFENVAFALEVTGFDKNFISHQVMIALQNDGMIDAKDRYPIHLSGGEKTTSCNC